MSIKTCTATTSATESFKVTLTWTSEKQEEHYEKIEAFANALLKEMNEAREKREKAPLLSEPALTQLEAGIKEQEEKLKALEKRSGEVDCSIVDLSEFVSGTMSDMVTRTFWSPSPLKLRQEFLSLPNLENIVAALDAKVDRLIPEANEVEKTSSKQLLETTSLVNRTILLETDCVQVSSHLSSSKALADSTTTTLETKRKIDAQRAEQARIAQMAADYNARMYHEYHRPAKCSIQ